jgi:hypothetical protein
MRLLFGCNKKIHSEEIKKLPASLTAFLLVVSKSSRKESLNLIMTKNSSFDDASEKYVVDIIIILIMIYSIVRRKVDRKTFRID